MKEKIEEFLKSENQDLKLGYIIPDTIIKILEEFGYKRDDWDFNGWQHDFGIACTKKDSPVIEFSGSWYYGNYYLTKLED